MSGHALPPDEHFWAWDWPLTTRLMCIVISSHALPPDERFWAWDWPLTMRLMCICNVEPRVASWWAFLGLRLRLATDYEIDVYYLMLSHALSPDACLWAWDWPLTMRLMCICNVEPCVASWWALLGLWLATDHEIDMFCLMSGHTLTPDEGLRLATDY